MTNRQEIIRQIRQDDQLSEAGCSHTRLIEDVEPSGDGCYECQKIGGTWVHLRMCLSCGQVGCCEASPNQHAKKHAAEGHPLIISFEPGEDWVWCYDDETLLFPEY